MIHAVPWTLRGIDVFVEPATLVGPGTVLLAESERELRARSVGLTPDAFRGTPWAYPTYASDLKYIVQCIGSMPTFVSLSARTEYKLLSAHEFLDWLEPGKHADLIDGEIEMHAPVSIRHARLTNFIDRLIGQYVERHSLGELFREVVAVKLGSRNVFLPDLAFYATGRLHLVRDTYVDGAPDLVVEVLSPTTGERDVGVKFAEYEQHGVAEYWILDPETLAHRFYAREGELLVEFAHDEQVIDSRTIRGLVVRREWLDPERAVHRDRSLLVERIEKRTLRALD